MIFKTRGGFAQSAPARASTPARATRRRSTTSSTSSSSTATARRPCARPSPTTSRNKLITYFAHPDPSPTLRPRASSTTSGFAAHVGSRRAAQADLRPRRLLPVAPAPPSPATQEVGEVADRLRRSAPLRLLHMKLKGKYQYVQGGSYDDIRDQLTNMGQILFEPPSVFGWDWETVVDEQLDAAGALRASPATSPPRAAAAATSFRPEQVLDLSIHRRRATSSTRWPTLLGVDDQLGRAPSARADRLPHRRRRPDATSICSDDDTRERKLNGLVGPRAAVAGLSSSTERRPEETPMADHPTSVPRSHRPRHRRRAVRPQPLPHALAAAARGRDDRRPLLHRPLPRRRQRRPEHHHPGERRLTIGSGAKGLRALYEDARDDPGTAGGIRIVNPLVPGRAPHARSATPARQLGFHPGLAALRDMYEQGMVAVLQGCGYPEYSLSHDVSRVDLGARRSAQHASAPAGWGAISPPPATSAATFPAVNIGGAVSGEYLQTDHQRAGLRPPAGLRLPVRRRLRRATTTPPRTPRSTRSARRAPPTATVRSQYIGSTGTATLTATNAYPALHVAVPGRPPVLEPPVQQRSTRRGLNTSTARGLREIAKVIYGVARGALPSSLGARLFELANGGYDTHSDQGGDEPDGDHYRLHREVADAIKLFYEDLADMAPARPVGSAASHDLPNKVTRAGVERVQPPHPPERQRHRSRLAGPDVRHRRRQRDQRRRLRQPSEHRPTTRPTASTTTATPLHAGQRNPHALDRLPRRLRHDHQALARHHQSATLAACCRSTATLGYSGPNYWTAANFNMGFLP